MKKIIYIVLLVIMVVLALTIYTNASKNNTENNGDKTASEIKFLESKIVDLLNKMNGIEIRNYKISYGEMTKKTQEQSGGESSKSGGSKSEEGEESSGGDGGSNEGDSSGSSSNSDSQKDTKGTEKKFEMKKTGVLSNNTEDINWEEIKLEIENLYSSIPTITVDLYRNNANQEDILSFNKEYDNLMQVAKNEDKEKTLTQLSKLYDYIPKFINNTSSTDIEKKVIEAKSNIFKAYSKLDNNNWKEIFNDVNNAVNSYSQLLSNTTIDSKKQYSINRIYILLNELKSSISLKDKQIFLIKYKNLLEEFDSL